jgi:uncharacterized repeat protein (TIGR03803 family)
MKTFLSMLLLVLGCGFAWGQIQYKVLWNFSQQDGAVPMGTLVMDRSGNLYGTTSTGGVLGTCYGGGCGVVYKLSPNGGGTWTETVLYTFCPNPGFVCPDGAMPQTGLTIDRSGNLYGVTELGGTCSGNASCGVAFELSPPLSSGGTWTYTVLYRFCSIIENDTCADGSTPTNPPVSDTEGNLYGTTLEGGPTGAGAVYELSSGVNGWTETILYNFCSLAGCVDGIFPRGVVFDALGNLHGATIGGGSLGGGGTVYALSPGPNSWTETVVLSLPQTLSGPQNPADLMIDAAGNSYMPISTGKRGAGGIGEIRANGRIGGFRFNGQDGKAPNSGFAIDDKSRILHGTTSGGNSLVGNVFQIDGAGTETVLYTFCQPDCSYGYEPLGGLVEDKMGNLYGTAASGGTSDAGVVFELTR